MGGKLGCNAGSLTWFNCDETSSGWWATSANGSLGMVAQAD
jgi:hypothetical protein